MTGVCKMKIGLLIGGFALFLFGLILSFFFEKIIFYRFEQELMLRPGSESFKKWIVTPVPLIMKVYFWNWTNPHQVNDTTVKPSFVEMGPYAFRESHEKVNLTWNKDGTVTYRTIKRWYFDKEKTKGSLDDEVTSLNAVAASVAYVGHDWKRYYQLPLGLALASSNQKLTWTKTVRELLFDGFDNAIQNIASYIPGFPALDKFGWFYKRNGTLTTDTYTIETGENGLDKLGELKLWNNQTLGSLYPKCANTGGSSGEFWPPKRTRNDTLKMFMTDLCREMIYHYEEDYDYNGLKTFIFAGTKETADNGSLIEENKCHCQKGRCPPSGVFDVSKCQFGAPIFMSYPHFYNADDFYRNSIEGMSPDPKKHKFYMAVEPRTGIQMDVRARMQVNLYLKKNTVHGMYRNVANVFVPVFWIENSASLSDEYTDGIKLLLSISESGPYIYYGLCVSGCLIVFGVILLHLFAYPISAAEKRKLNGSIKGQFQKGEEIQMKNQGNVIKEVEYTFTEVRL